MSNYITSYAYIIGYLCANLNEYVLSSAIARFSQGYDIHFVGQTGTVKPVYNDHLYNKIHYL